MTLIIYLIMAAIVVGGAFAVRSHIEGIGEKKAEARLQPQIVALTADRKTAVDANTSLRSDLTLLTAERNACSASITAIEVEGKLAEENKKKARAKAAPKLQAVQASIEVQQARLVAPQTGATCEEVVSKMGRNLVNIGGEQLRDSAAARSSSDSKGPPAGKGSSDSPMFRVK